MPLLVGVWGQRLLIRERRVRVSVQKVPGMLVGSQGYGCRITQPFALFVAPGLAVISMRGPLASCRVFG